MKKETWFLKLALLGLGLPIILLCIFALPNLYQDAYHAFPDMWVTPIMVVMYVSVLPYLYALVQAFKLLSFIDNQNAFSIASVKAIQQIKYCALSVFVKIVVSKTYKSYDDFSSMNSIDSSFSGLAILFLPNPNYGYFATIY